MGEVVILMEDVSYESLPNSSVVVQLFAGGLAGITEHVVTYPLDSMKTRMQELNFAQKRLLSGLLHVRASEGLRSLWRGLPSVVFGSGPAHALFFATYEQSKSLLARVDKSKHKHATHG
jgi:solute carrier family 25 iron transporter 28/37